MTRDCQSATFRREGAEALTLMQRALACLDLCDPAGDVAPHLDLAICRLRDLLETPHPGVEVEE
jgi:hypothetical protein